MGKYYGGERITFIRPPIEKIAQIRKQIKKVNRSKDTFMTKFNLKGDDEL